ncbi:MAG TPA: carboxypeptidase regulatory-like domain-containing protein [Bryobacteraceae bacterium]|nr:carboxypeptidase regulatory-like domain-containing protein [Bryobacteraceae bacterium]
MLNGRATFRFATAALVISSTVAFAAPPIKLSGSIAGIVRDSAGVPQMGATVLLFNRYEKLLNRALTNERGIFGFDTLPPDVYSVQVTLSTFIPAMKRAIAVQPGMQSLLYINLATVLSSIELVYAAPGQGALMSDDWKWTLKSAAATRPILRYTPDDTSKTSSSPRNTPPVFSDTRGMVKVSGGDPGTLASDGGSSDLGTAFALATSLYGRNQLQVSGGVGYMARTGMPTAGFSTTYSRDGMSPEVTVTMRQISLPTRAGSLMMAQQDGMPALRSLSVGTLDHLSLGDTVRLDYGISMDSVSFVNHMNYYSPFARLTYDLGGLGNVQFAYSAGGPATELVTGSTMQPAQETTAGSDPVLSQSLGALALLPRVSLRDDHARVQRTTNFEIGYEKRFASRTFNVSGFHEDVSNAALTMTGPDSLIAEGDVIPDLASNASIVNAGNFHRYGYAVSATQEIGDHFEVSGSAGRAGVLTAGNETDAVASVDELRSRIQSSQRYWMSARASAKLPGTGTQITSSYEWTDYSALMPTHLYLTQKAYPEPGLNIHVRQPIPSFPGLPGRLEATADLRNMLGQGYLPLVSNGQRVLVMQSPRMVRGGLSFIF